MTFHDHPGGGAVESLLEKVEIPGTESQHAQALTLQIPLKGAIAEGGIKLVLRTSRDPVQWLGCTFQGSRHDMFIDLRKVRLHAVRQRKPKAGPGLG